MSVFMSYDVNLFYKIMRLIKQLSLVAGDHI
jgi:hypothetical protein